MIAVALSLPWTVAQSVLSTPAVVQYGEVNQTGRCLECRSINYITRASVLGSINKNLHARGRRLTFRNGCGPTAEMLYTPHPLPSLLSVYGSAVWFL